MEFPISPVVGGGHLTLFGDESYHWSVSGDRLSYVYAFVGATPAGYQLLDHALRGFKERVRRDSDPNSWIFHTADLRSSRWRKRNGVALDIVELNNEMRRLASEIGAHDRDVFLYVGAALNTVSPTIAGKSNKLSFVRDHLLMASFIVLTDDLTKQGASPSFVLEQVGNAASPEFMDAYVERIGRSLFHSLSFLYAARCKFVGLPTTVPKNSGVEIQIADFVAYWANRYFYLHGISRQSEVPMELFGPANWGSMSGKHFGLFPGTGFPWDIFSPVQS